MSEQTSCTPGNGLTGQSEQTSRHTFVLPVRVYYEDTDAGGVVYHSNYLNFFERTRTEWMRQLGYELNELAKQQQIVFVVRSLSCDYLKPALFNDELFVSAEIIEVGKTSIIFEQKVMRAKSQDGSLECETLAIGTVSVVCVDSEKFRAKRIPPQLMETFQSVI